jgi:hypothetical protein
MQCLAQDHSCRTAVATAKDRGWLPPNASPGTAAYCRARDALAAADSTGFSGENMALMEL